MNSFQNPEEQILFSPFSRREGKLPDIVYFLQIKSQQMAERGFDTDLKTLPHML